MKIQSLVSTALLGILALAPIYATAAEDNMKSVAAINENMTNLVGQKVSAQGKVVKVNDGIMKRNFIHVQDGTGDANSNNLIVTSKQTARVGDEVTVSGVVVLNRDFGSGYSYPLLIEDASIDLKK